MPIRAECNDCGRKLQVKDAAAGRRIKCPDCGSVVRIPDAPSVSAAAAPERRKKATSRRRSDEDHGDLDFGALASMAAGSRSLGAGELEPCLNCGRDVGSKARECPHCGENLRELKAELKEDAHRERIRQEKEEERQAKQLLASTVVNDDDEGGVMGYLIFFMIFVVGNVILYYTTGWVIIPRR